jgi:hypothetical protein
MSNRRQRHAAMVTALAKRGIDPVKLATVGTTSDRVKTGTVATPRKVMVTDRRITDGRKESAITEFAQNRHEFTGTYENKIPAKRRPVTNGSANHVRIAQLPTGTKPVWR